MLILKIKYESNLLKQRLMSKKENIVNLQNLILLYFVVLSLGNCLSEFIGIYRMISDNFR